MSSGYTWLGRVGTAVALAGVMLSAQALPPQLFKPEWVLPRVTITAPAQGQVALITEPQALQSLTYEFAGVPHTVKDFQERGQVKSLLVLHEGKVVYEHHRWPYGPQSLHQSWSLMKQMLSALVGVALKEGRIKSVDEPMDRYAPELAVNGFAHVTFRQALLMSSGVRYSEEADRVQLFKDVIAHRLTAGRTGKSLRSKTLAHELAAAYVPGGRYDYASINSQAIAMALQGATGQPVDQLLRDKLWKPMGMLDDAEMLVDGEGRDFTFCCLYATARSYAMFGQLYAQGGRWQGRTLLSEDWVRRSTGFVDPWSWHAHAVTRTAKTMDLFGFAYHWWTLEGGRGDFTGSGILGQSVYVSPRQNVVVVRLSDDYEPGSHNEESVFMARAVADHLSRAPTGPAGAVRR
jgi:CubicO group peptidase (beta-lactamase class C family)